MQLLFCDLSELGLEHGKETLASVDGKADGRVSDQVKMRVAILGEKESNSKTTRVGVDMSIRNILETGIAAEAGEKVRGRTLEDGRL